MLNCVLRVFLTIVKTHCSVNILQNIFATIKLDLYFTRLDEEFALGKKSELTILHTADWHLGHQLHGVSRSIEHQAFLDWLITTVENEHADVLIVAGDIFDTANPSALAVQQLNSFIVQLNKRCPNAACILIAGNHDSAARLESLSPLWQSHNTWLTGRVLDESGEFDPQKLLIPIKDKLGEIRAWCAAMPFLRPSDLPVISQDNEATDTLVDGVAARYQQILETAQSVQNEGQFLIATGHCYMVNSQLSELSERRVLGGNQHALPATVFSDNWDYVALGHLHLAQKVGSETVRYSGSPIPLSLGEQHYPHQLLKVTLGQGDPAKIEPVKIPRTIEMMRVPARSTAVLDDVLAQLEDISFDHSLDAEHWPFLEVHVLLDKPQSGLRQRIEQVIEEQPVRLLKISSHYQNLAGRELTGDKPQQELQDLKPDDVFIKCYQQTYPGQPSEQLNEAFNHCCEYAQKDGAPS